MNHRKLLFLSSVVALLQAGCTKVNDLDRTGYWELAWIHSLDIDLYQVDTNKPFAARADYDRLCNGPVDVAVDIDQSRVDRRFWDSRLGAYTERDTSALRLGDLSSNDGYGAPALYTPCSGIDLQVYNRSVISLTGGTRWGYQKTGTDALGRCVIRIEKPRDKRIMAILMRVKAPAQIDPETNLSDAENNNAQILYDCESHVLSRAASSSKIQEQEQL